jgi:23S rRNA pseudouridine955/2504/2580 synthase
MSVTDLDPGKPWWWRTRWIFKVLKPVRASLCLENKENIYIITRAEAGMKALRFLERRLSLPRPLLFKLLRTGKIRINRSRVKPEHILAVGDEVKIPRSLYAQGGNGTDQPAFSSMQAAVPERERKNGSCAAGQAPSLGPGLDVVYMDEYLLVLNKAPGLPAHPGSKHTDSVSARLDKAFEGSYFIPAPAHRLDKQSSGLILAGRVYQAQRHLHRLFSACKAELDRRYLVWVSGVWDLPDKTLFRDCLGQKKGADNLERMYVLENTEDGVEAVAEYRTLKILSAVVTRQAGACSPQELTRPARIYRANPCRAMLAGGLCPPLSKHLKRKGHKAGQKAFPAGRADLNNATLLEVRLLTGRKHQIRVQCASRGYPVIGDARYAGPSYAPMLLHACKITLPGVNPVYTGSAEAPFCSGHF